MNYQRVFALCSLSNPISSYQSARIRTCYATPRVFCATRTHKLDVQAYKMRQHAERFVRFHDKFQTNPRVSPISKFSRISRNDKTLLFSAGKYAGREREARRETPEVLAAPKILWMSYRLNVEVRDTLLVERFLPCFLFKFADSSILASLSRARALRDI